MTTWTKTAPFSPGFYWVKMPYCDSAEIVEVFLGYRELQFYRIGVVEAFDMTNPMLWGVELIEPEE